MKQMFGTAFTTAYGDQPSAIWLDGIAGLTDEQCAAGFRLLRKELRRYPPNLTEFIAACRQTAPGVRYLGGPSSQFKPLPLDHKPATPERRAEHIANCRKALGR
jgi:hypothetical protein